MSAHHMSHGCGTTAMAVAAISCSCIKNSYLPAPASGAEAETVTHRRAGCVRRWPSQCRARSRARRHSIARSGRGVSAGSAATCGRSRAARLICAVVDSRVGTDAGQSLHGDGRRTFVVAGLVGCRLRAPGPKV